MQITIGKLIELLNTDLELEYAAAIQYINHVAVLPGATFAHVIRELEVHASEELQNAMVLSTQINQLGGTPSVNVGSIFTSKDNEEMLQHDLESEENVIGRYKTRIEQADFLGLVVLAQQLRNILATEESHAANQRHAIGK